MEEPVPTPTVVDWSAAADRNVARTDWAPYVSPLVYDRIDDAHQSCGVALQLDIGGFTASVERYSLAGTAGLEQIAELVGRCFGTLVDTIDVYGGAVHTFPGDSIIAVWETRPDALASALQQAVACAHELTRVRAAESTFPLKAAVGAGQMLIAPLGGIALRRELLVTGDALRQMAAALNIACAGQVVISAVAWRELAHHGRAALLNADNYLLNSAPLVARPEPRQRKSCTASKALEFVPRIVRERLLSGMSEWIGEFRHATVLMIQICDGAGDNLASLAAIFERLQRVIYDLEGSVVQLCHDDKGIVVLCALGIRQAHEDDPDRALLAALEVSRELDRSGHGSHCGVASGRLYCGLLGSRRRLDYRLVGNVVNIAGRLMALGRGVLCDANTKRRSRGFIFESSGELPLKGLAANLPVFRVKPGSVPGFPSSTATAAPSSAITLFGRDSELELARRWLQRAGCGDVLAIIGEAGIGKTHLASVVLSEARQAGRVTAFARSAESSASLPFRALRPVIEQLLDLDPEGGATRRSQLQAWVERACGSAAMAPLLEDIFPVGFEQTEATRTLEGEVRANNRLQTVSRLLLVAGRAQAREHGQVVVQVEDAQWLDDPTWTAMRVLAAAADSPFQFVLTARAAPTEVDVAFDLSGGERTTLLRLHPLDLDAVTRIAELRCGARHISRRLAVAIHARTDGNPFFCEELVMSLLEQGALEIEQGTVRLKDPALDLAQSISESVDKVLRTRMDRLPQSQQFVLKAASVIGLRFDVELLRVIHPHCSGVQLMADLAALVAGNLLHRQDDHGSHYAFRHAVTRDVVYASLLFKQREELHGATARALESGSGLHTDVLEIFQHWRAANDVTRALSYVEQEGERALRLGDYAVAGEYFSFGVKHLPAVNNPGDGKSARWNQQLGEVEVALGRHESARRHLERALALSGMGIPDGDIAAGLAITRQIVVQFLHRTVSQRHLTATRGDAYARAAEAYEQLGYIYYASGNTVRGVLASLRMLNLAERAAISPVLARAQAAMGLAVSVTPLRAMADFYEHAGRRVSVELRDERCAGWVGWIASLRAAGEARWAEVERGTDAAIHTATRYSDQRLHIMATLTRAWADHMLGNVEHAKTRARVALGIARDHGNHLWEAWALNAQAEADLMRGAHEEVAQSCQRVLDILSEESDLTEEIRAAGMLALALFALRQEDRAVHMADSLIARAHGVQLTSYLMLEGFAGIAEVRVALCEQARDSDSGIAQHQLMAAQQTCRVLRRFAAVFPVAYPRYWYLVGRLYAADHQRPRAQLALARAAFEAQRLALPREYAQIVAAIELLSHGDLIAKQPRRGLRNLWGKH